PEARSWRPSCGGGSPHSESRAASKPRTAPRRGPSPTSTATGRCWCGTLPAGSTAWSRARSRPSSVLRLDLQVEAEIAARVLGLVDLDGNRVEPGHEGGAPGR